MIGRAYLLLSSYLADSWREAQLSAYRIGWLNLVFLLTRITSPSRLIVSLRIVLRLHLSIYHIRLAGHIGNNDNTVCKPAAAVTTAICNHVGSIVSTYEALLPAPAVHNEFPN